MPKKQEDLPTSNVRNKNLEMQKSLVKLRNKDNMNFKVSNKKQAMQKSLVKLKNKDWLKLRLNAKKRKLRLLEMKKNVSLLKKLIE